MGNQQIVPKQLDNSPSQSSKLPQSLGNATFTQNHPTKLPPITSVNETLTAPQLKPSATSSSFSKFRLTSASKLKIKRKNTNETLQLTQNIEEDDGLSLDELDNIYFLSGANNDEFYNNLQEPLAKIYTDSSKYALNLMTSKLMLTKKQAKLFLCEKILKASLNVMKILGQKSHHEFNESVFKQFNDLQRSIIGYLKTKYPTGQQNFVSGDLMKVFKPFDYIDSPENDIVRQAGFYFRQELTRDLLKNIKEFLNELIDETDLNFPRFQKMFQDRIFKTNNKGDKSLIYRLDRRLPETISKFTSVNSNSLDIDSPEMFQVVLKWVNDMEEFLINTHEQVQEKQTFKVINEEDDVKYSVDQITTEENSSIRQQLKEALQNERENYQNELNNLINSMYRFQHNLVKIVEQGELKERYVPRKDAELIKFAAYNTKFMSWMLAQKLTMVMKKLIKVGRSFKNTILMVPMDLIKFNVIDMLRASMQGTKGQILQVYGNLKKLQSQQQIKIIRLENHLSTTTNDIKINFKLKNCFLICELQMILSESSHSPNQKLKCMKMFHDFFQDLEASPYGVMSEFAEYVGYKDSKVGFEKKINFVSKEVGIPMCEIGHPAKISTIKEQLEPFVCTSCSKFYGRLQNLFTMKTCKPCNNFLCSTCIFAKNPTLVSAHLKQSIIDYLNSQVALHSEVNRSKTDASPVTGNLIFGKAFEKFVLVKDITKEKKLKKMTITQFQAYIDQQDRRSFVYGIYEKGEISLVCCQYNQILKELSFAMDQDQDFYSSKKIAFKPNDFILFYNPITIATRDSPTVQKALYVNIFSSETKLKKGKYNVFEINQTMILTGFSCEDGQEKLADGQEAIEAAFYSDTKKEFKFDSLNTYFQYQGQADYTSKKVKLQDLGIEKRHLSHFTTAKWASQIVEINLSKNKIADINELLKVLPNIQRLIATQNYIHSFTPPIKLNSLTSVVLKRNLIKQITKMQNFPNIQKLNLQENRISTLPTLSIKSLRHFNLALNSFLTSIDFVQRSQLLELTYLNLEGSTDNVQYSNSDQENRSITIPYKKLKCFIINNLRATKLNFLSEVLQRLELSSSLVSELQGKFPNLEYFIADSCKFTNFNELFGSSCQNHVIKQIHLQYGQVTQLPAVLQSRSLRKMYLHNNKLQDVSALGKSGLPSLEQLNISYNEIKTIPKLSFKKLQDLRFEGNYLEDIDEFAQSQLPQVKVLQFSGSQPVKGWPGFDFPKLTELYLPSLHDAGVGFEEFERSCLPKLTILVIQYSKLEKFPVINFPSLQNLRIEFGRVVEVENLARCTFPNLQTVSITSINPEYEQMSAEELLKCKIDLPSNLQKLQQMTITSCRLANIPQIMAKPYANLQRIYIQYSFLTTVPKMALPKLKGLHLYSNHINNLDQFYESDLPAMQELDLSSNKLTVINKLTFKSLQTLNVSSNQLTSINGLQLPSLVTIDFSYNQLQHFPALLAQKLTDLTFSSNPLKSLDQMEKCCLPSLKNLSFNSISLQDQNTILPKFQMPNIQSLSISTINFVGVENINMLKKLTFLEISYCSNIKQFPTLELDELKSLTVLQSTMEDWSGLWLSKVQNLQYVCIQSTNIQKMGGLVCSELLEMNICNNQKLQDIQPLIISNTFTLLQTVTIQNNPALKIQNQLNLPHVKYVYMSGMALPSTRCIGHSDKMTVISLKDSSLPQLNLREFKKLQNLDVSNCKLEDITKFCTVDWKHLKWLLLSENNITNIPIMAKFPSLQSLYLNNNQIANPKQLLQNSHLPNLSTLNLEHNQITHITSLKNFPTLSTLQLDYNLIQDLSFLNHFQNVNPFISSIFLTNNKVKQVPPIKSATEVLSLSDNLIETMDFVDKCDLPRLINLILVNNQIKKMLPVTKLTKLISLSLDSNPIEDYEDFFMKSKLPISMTYISASLNVSEQKLDIDRQQYITKHSNISVALFMYTPPVEQVQDDLQPSIPQNQNNLD